MARILILGVDNQFTSVDSVISPRLRRQDYSDEGEMSTSNFGIKGIRREHAIFQELELVGKSWLVALCSYKAKLFTL